MQPFPSTSWSRSSDYTAISLNLYNSAPFAQHNLLVAPSPLLHRNTHITNSISPSYTYPNATSPPQLTPSTTNKPAHTQSFNSPFFSTKVQQESKLTHSSFHFLPLSRSPPMNNPTEEERKPPKEPVLCEVCKENPYKYTCPGCNKLTCSLACVKKHKAYVNSFRSDHCLGSLFGYPESHQIHIHIGVQRWRLARWFSSRLILIPRLPLPFGCRMEGG